MISVDPQPNVRTKDVVGRWDSQGVELGPVFDEYQVWISRAVDKNTPVVNQQSILEIAVWNDHEKRWQADGEDFLAVAATDLGEPTDGVLLVPIRKGFCVKTAVHHATFGQNLRRFNMEARYPWDNRRELRLQPYDSIGEEIDKARIFKPKHIPRAKPTVVDARSPTRTTFLTAPS